MAKEIKFEQGLKRLENIVEELEKDDLDLDKSLKMFEEGVKISRLCTKQLDSAEKKIEILLKDEDGNVVAKPFDKSLD